MFDTTIDVAALQAENDALRERVGQLEYMLLSSGPPIPAQWFLTPIQFAIVNKLRFGRCIGTPELSKAMRAAGAKKATNLEISGTIGRINRKLTSFGYRIRCVPGLGYRFDLLRDNWREPIHREVKLN